MESRGLSSFSVTVTWNQSFTGEFSFLLPHERNTVLTGESGLLLGHSAETRERNRSAEPQCPRVTPYAPVPEDFAGKWLLGKFLGCCHETQWGTISFTNYGKFLQRSSLISCAFIIEIWKMWQLTTLASYSLISCSIHAFSRFPPEELCYVCHFARCTELVFKCQQKCCRHRFLFPLLSSPKCGYHFIVKSSMLEVGLSFGVLPQMLDPLMELTSPSELSWFSFTHCAVSLNILPLNGLLFSHTSLAAFQCLMLLEFRQLPWT